MSAKNKMLNCRSAVFGEGIFIFIQLFALVFRTPSIEFSHVRAGCWKIPSREVQVWAWIVGFQTFEAPRDCSKIRSWPWATRSWPWVGMTAHGFSLGCCRSFRRWAMTSGSARTLCDMTKPKRELPKSPFFQAAFTWNWKCQRGRFSAESSMFSTSFCCCERPPL